MSRRQGPTLLEVTIGRLGPLKGARVLAFMIAWDTTAQAVGHAPTLAEHAEYWHESERTGYRDLARFRECFPHERDPTRIMAVARAQFDQTRGVRGLGAVDVSRVGVVL